MSIQSSLELNEVLEQMHPYCSFSMGEDTLLHEEISYDPLQIRRKRDLIADALACVIQFGTMPFGGIHDVRDTLKNAQKGRILSAPELLDVLHLIRGIRGILQYDRSISVPHDNLQDLISTLSVSTEAEKKIAACINEYGEVTDNASPALRQIRMQKRQAEADISAAVNRFLADHAASVVDSIVTYRQDRAVILVKSSEKNSFQGLVYGDSASGQASYVEPASLIGPNNRKQELLSKEKEEIDRILALCSAAVGSTAEQDISNLETCALLDSLFAKAQWGKERNGIAASLTEKKNLYLKRAVHPLIPREKAVSNTYRIEDPIRMLLITGPNTGGKTVSLKIIGLSVLMTYLGMPILADEAVIPYFDAVYADIGDDQSVAASLSSFSAHIQKLADVVNHATGSSLALMDEIGSGTDPREGEAIAIAVMHTLRERGTVSVATTHYGRLKAYGKRHKDILTASVQFDMQKLMPTYKYCEGLTGSSNAFEVAQRYGLPQSIIRYARFLKDQAKTQEDELIDKLEKQLSEVQQMKEQLQSKEDEMNLQMKQIKTEQVRLERQKDDFKQKAEMEAQKYLEKTRAEADEILKEMRSQQMSSHYHEVLKTAKKLDQPELKIETPASVNTDAPMKVGDTVELRSTGQIARLTSMNRKDCTIEINGREMHVKKQQIRESDRIIPVIKEKPIVFFSSTQTLSSASAECNLIGMHVDEAMDEMNAFIDQARLHHMKTFRIIHGDGSGALRKAVHAKLAKMNDVESYRIGMPQEGGTGATVVLRRED